MSASAAAFHVMACPLSISRRGKALVPHQTHEESGAAQSSGKQYQDENICARGVSYSAGKGRPN